MTAAAWPPLDALLAALGTVPSRTGSVISTIYGDAVLPRGGMLALADLLVLMRRLGASDGVVRTAMSRLAGDGLLVGRRNGRSSAYALTERGRTEFEQAGARIYGPLDRDWDGQLRLAFATEAADRAGLEAAGFASLGPGLMLGFDAAPVALPVVTGSVNYGADLVARAWPQGGLAAEYGTLAARFAPLAEVSPPTPLDAMAARVALLHAYRRLALRTTRLPATLSPWFADMAAARTLCIRLYTAWAPASELWLDGTSDGSGPLPRGPDPVDRFSGGGRPPSVTAWSPSRSGTPRRARSGPR